MRLHVRYLISVIMFGTVCESSIAETTLVIQNATTPTRINQTSAAPTKRLKVRVAPFIVGGRDAKIEDHSHQVLLEIRGQRCSGSIISQYLILTVGHCLYQKNRQDIAIWYGKTNVSQTKEDKKHGAKRIEIHPLYNHTTTDYDAGLIWIDKKIHLNNSTKKIIGLVDPSYILKPGSEVTVSGWGKTISGDANSMSPTLQEVKVPVINWHKCRNLFRSIREYKVEITPRMWCAGFLRFGGRDACQGDSGAAAVQNNKIVGLVSWSLDGCGDPNIPGVYTDIRAVQPWIILKMNEKTVYVW